MRIAFHGKGGAGKTTTTAGFIRYAAERHPFVLAVDADLNTHLKDALSFIGEAKHIGAHYDEVTTHLKGRRTDIGNRPMICTLPPSAQSNFVRVSPQDEFIRKYCSIENNIALLTVGRYEQSDVGTSCYHEKLKSLMGVFHHMLDGENDMVVADTIAGTDNIATSLSFAYDMNVFVVEPTEKSISVYRDYAELVPQYANQLYVIGNKVTNAEDEQFIKDRIASQVYLGSIPFSGYLKRFEQGQTDALSQFHKEQEQTFTRTYEVLKSKKRDWLQYLERLRATYEWDCQRWYSDFYKCDMLEGLDQTFTYDEVLFPSSAEPVLTKV